MKIRFVKQWKRHQVQSVAEVADGAANVLIRRKIAVPDEPAMETAAIESAPERAVVATAKTRKQKR